MACQNIRIECLRETACDLDLNAFAGDQKVGWATAEVSGSRVQLCDIHVRDDVTPPRSAFIRLLSPAMRRDIQSYRGQGIGGLLLRHLLREADAMAAEEVWGFVVQDDLSRSPFLLEWYGRHGFEVVAPDAECMDGAVKKIARRLNTCH
ncbi:MAG: hypothetical protein WD042_15905 [Phycisphaeraceae bacterium]